MNSHKFTSLIFILLISYATSDNLSFPLYKQCDPRWSSIPLGFGPDTVCEIGSFLCSVSMMLTGHGILLNGISIPTPQNTNNWLLDYNGYSGYNFSLSSLSSLGFIYLGGLKQIQDILKYVDQDSFAVILHVNNGNYVLATGYNSTGIFVQDPYYNRTMYNLSEIVDAPLYYLESEVIQQNQANNVGVNLKVPF